MGRIPVAKISITLKPGAKRNKIEIDNNETATVYVTSRPVERKANEHLIRLLSKVLKIPKSSCEIVHGIKSRFKTVDVQGLDKEEIIAKLKKTIVR